MPQSAQEHRDNQVDILAHLTLTVASQGDIDIVTNPRRQRDMPATPEIGDTLRTVRGVEVHGETEAQQQGDTDSHITIAREIAIDLKGIAIDTQEILHTTIERGIIEDAVHEIQGDIITDDGFLEQTDGNEIAALGKHLRGNLKRFTNLWGKVASAHNRSCHQLGEERHIEGVVEQRRQGFQITTIHVDDIRHRLEREERNPHWQEDVPRLEITAHHLCPQAGEEIGVFEIAKKTQVDK